eukprot:14473403-Ditylum_brightwellii.AAC.1
MPLSYVIREDKPNKWTAMPRREKLIYNAALNGPVFTADNTAVYGAMKQWTIATDGYNWIKQYDDNKNGHRDIVAIQTHYSGPGEVAKRTAQAKKAKSDGEKVELMIKKITSNDQVVRAAVHVIVMDSNLNKNFRMTANSLSDQITKIQPNVRQGGRKRQYHQVSSM